MKLTRFIAILGLFTLSFSVNAQQGSLATVDSFNLQRITLQDTFLLRVIPDYIKVRTNANGEIRFQNKGVLVVIIPRERTDSLIRYRIRTEYDNFGLINRWKFLHPLFYAQIAGRYVVVCDEWTGSLVPLSTRSQLQAISEFSKAGWLDIVNSPAESSMETHSSAYVLRRPSKKK